MNTPRTRCTDCKYSYTNETLTGSFICVNGESVYLGEYVDGYGYAEDSGCEEGEEWNDEL